MNCALSNGARLFRRTRFFCRCAPLTLVVLWSIAAYPQAQRASEDPTSELARQNLERVAASATQIGGVLHRDAGLMVELKRWVAKDATDHGQLVSDSDLTDQAIYDRLELDVEFRSVATVLLQRYGYLVPRPNPDSPQAKEQEILIQNWANRLAHDEEERRVEEREQRNRPMVEARGCDPGKDQNCDSQGSAYPPEDQLQQIGTPALPPRSAPRGPGLPQHNASSVEQTVLLQGADAIQGSPALLPLTTSVDVMSPFPIGLHQAGPGSLAGSAPQPSRNVSGGESAASPPGTDGSVLLGLESATDYAATDGEAVLGISGETEGTNPAQLNSYHSHSPTKVSLNQAMLRLPVPYAGVPSLYDMYLQALPHPPAPERFGTEVFQNGTRDSQLIPFDLPVGPDYVIGPGDGLAIDLWGGVSQRFVRTVDREGRVSLPEAGPLLVSGKSLADVQESVQKILRSQFRDVSVDVSLSRLRTIRVYIVGDVAHPGAYDISSLSTPLNALFAAGGPTREGSLRNCRHNRGNQLVQNVDAYDLLLHGVKIDIQRLENGDTVLVPTVGPEVSVEGMVRRPAIYELRDEKSLSDVLTLAGGLLPTATLRHVEVQRVVAHDKRTMLSLDVLPDANPASVAEQLNSFQVQDGDKIHIFPIAPYNQDTLYLEGHVLRPGRYSYHSGMRVTDLVSSYKDLLPEPAAQYAEIIRLNPPDYRPTVESFNLADAFEHPGGAPLLEPLDSVQIFGRYDFEDAPTVSVWGNVRVPGTYRTSGQLHLSDAIHMAGGLSPDADEEDAQVFRHLPDGKLKILSVRLAEALAGDPAVDVVLNSRDRIIVHRNPADVQPATVYVKGEVARPGRYPLAMNMTVADLIRAAGGPKQSADLNGADLTHYEWNGQSRMTGKRQQIELADALAGRTDANVSLHNGDVLTVSELPGWDDLGASITVRGEVTHPGSYGIRPGERLSSILKRAGGFMPDAYPYGAVLTRSEVQQIEAKSQTELVERVREQQTSLKLAAKAAQDPDERASEEAAYQQWQNTLDVLMNNPPLGRVMIQISGSMKSWEGTPRDIAVRAGDRLLIPKRPSYVLVQGQVFNAAAIAYRPGKSAKWYLSQAGGPTTLANKKEIFVIRADGSVLGSRGSSLFSGNALGESLKPGDTVVVPEKALGGPRTWKVLFQTAQVGTSIATSLLLAANYF